MSGSDSFDWQVMVEELTSILSAVSDGLSEAGLQVQVEDIGVLIYVGEYLLALEQLCGNLEDTGLPVPQRLHAAIERVGRQLGADPAIWERLRPQVAG